MKTKPDLIQHITIDGQSFPVADMTDELQRQVLVYEIAHDRAQELEVALIIGKAALDKLGLDLVAAIRAQNAPTADK